VLPGVVVVAPEPVVVVPPPTPLVSPLRVFCLASSSAELAPEVAFASRLVFVLARFALRGFSPVAVSARVLEPAEAPAAGEVTGEAPCAFELSGRPPPVSTLRPCWVCGCTPEAPVLALPVVSAAAPVFAPVLALPAAPVCGTVPCALELSGRAPPVSTLRPCAAGFAGLSLCADVCANALNETAATPQKSMGINLGIDVSLGKVPMRFASPVPAPRPSALSG
jgi:hypothetical protein